MRSAASDCAEEQGNARDAACARALERAEERERARAKERAHAHAHVRERARYMRGIWRVGARYTRVSEQETLYYTNSESIHLYLATTRKSEPISAFRR